jgi:hypothetical protein
MMVKLILAIAGLMLLGFDAAIAQNAASPEVVQLENMFEESGMRTVYVGNANNHYLLYCDTQAGGCIKPEENKNYLLFDANTRWKMPGAKDFLTLSFIQELTVKYNKGENVGLVAEDGKGEDVGLFIRDPTGGGYEQEVIVSDGPIAYGAGLSDADRHAAWKTFFMKMLEAVAQQQGKDALVTKLARRCMPGQDFCTTTLDADLVGIGGIREPRKVALFVSTDLHDQKKQLARTVCTYPAKGTIICRDWDTGKLMSVQHPQQKAGGGN